MNFRVVAGIARRRLQNQGLLSRAFGKPVEVVRWLGAVQAQDYHGAKWALAQRTADTDNATLDRAFDRGEILRRTHPDARRAGCLICSGPLRDNIRFLRAD